VSKKTLATLLDRDGTEHHVSISAFENSKFVLFNGKRYRRTSDHTRGGWIVMREVEDEDDDASQWTAREGG